MSSVNKNAALPEIIIKLDKERRLVFDFNALCRLEELTGKNALSGETWSNLTARDVRALLWSAMLRDDPELKLEEVGELVNFKNLSKVTQALEKAFVSASIPEDDKSMGKK